MITSGPESLLFVSKDNVFPKRCCFYAGVRRELVSIEEHCGKIQAAKAAQDVPDFMVIARTEALMAGWGIEAVKHIYHELQNRGQHQGVHEAPSLEPASLTDILQELIEAGQDVQAIFTYKGWMDVDSFEDYQKAWAEIS